MPVNFLTDAERLRFNSFPANLSNEDLIAHFTLSDTELIEIPVKTTEANRLGFAIYLVLLRFLGFHLASFETVPTQLINFVAEQISVESKYIESYGIREQTRSNHQRKIEKYLGYRPASSEDVIHFTDWTSQHSLEHDRPLLLLQLLCDYLRKQKIVRPGLTILEKLVGSAREKANQEIYQRLLPVLNENVKADIDEILIADEPNQPTQLAWLRTTATSNTPKNILATIEKLNRLQHWNINEWDLSILNPNRRKQLANIGFRSTAQGISRMSDQKKYPILLSFIYQIHEEILDELVELFDRLLQKVNAKTERKLIQINQEAARIAKDKIRLLQKLVGILLNPEVTDEELRDRIYQQIPEEKLKIAYDECEQLNKTNDNEYFEVLGLRYSYIRQFVPIFLDALPIDGNAETEGLREAIDILRTLDESGKRKIPDDAPVDFIIPKWWNSVFDDEGRIKRKYYELCVLYQLRSNLRAGNIWVEGSRRYGKLDSYLISNKDWIIEKDKICSLLTLPDNGEIRLSQRQREMETLYEKFDNLFNINKTLKKSGNTKDNSGKVLPFKSTDEISDNSKSVNVRLENGNLVITKPAGEEVSDSSLLLEKLVSERLPEVELTDILIEVDSWTHFSRYFQHPNGKEPRSRDALANCYASILAQACNYGLVQMSRMSGITYRKLAWHTTWYLREETLKSAFSELVNFHNRQNLSKVWGGGTLSSSDGQDFRFP